MAQSEIQTFCNKGCYHCISGCSNRECFHYYCFFPFFLSLFFFNLFFCLFRGWTLGCPVGLDLSYLITTPHPSINYYNKKRIDFMVTKQNGKHFLFSFFFFFSLFSISRIELKKKEVLFMES